MSAERVEGMPRLEIERIRADFPVLHQEIHGKPLVYLDSAASSQKPTPVLDAMDHLYRHDYANIHRGVHTLSERSTRLYESVREKARAFLGARESREIIFVRGTTEAINLVAQSYGRARLTEGDEILITGLEHHSNIVPWQILRDQVGATLRVVPLEPDGSVSVARFAESLTDRTRVVALAHVSNALGTVLPVAEMAALARARGVPVLVDGAQAVPHLAVDVRALGADFYCFSGHKVYGPSGIGCLYGRAELLESMPPYQGGGDMIRRVTFEETEFNELPWKFEAGTPDIAGVVGLGAALDYVTAIGLPAIHAHEDALVQEAMTQLGEIEGVKFIGTAAERASVVSFVVEGIHPHDLGTILDREGIAIRAGHHCAQPVMDFFGVPATARASFGMYNTSDDVARLAAGVRLCQEVFG